MTKSTLKIIIVVIVAVLVALELFYFRFHTYFQSKEINEPLPIVQTSSQAESEQRTVVRGTFVGVDAVHKGSGTARIIEDGDKRYLRLENFEVTNGPDLYVYLTESRTPGNDLKSLDKYISLGELKGNVGNQNYEIPNSFRGYDTAVIWCQQFGVLFAYALMQ